MTDIQQQLHEARKHQILDAAIGVIAENGFQKTSIKKIAQAASIADGTIYNYFKNKDAILLAIVERLTQNEIDDLQQAQLAKMDANTFIDTFVRARMADVDEMYQTLKVLLPETINNPDLAAKTHEEVYAPGYAIAEQYLAHVSDNDQLEPSMTARLFTAPLLGLLLMRMLGDPHVTDNWHAYTEALIPFLKKSLTPDTDTLCECDYVK